ncbi:MAG: hypothetical protein KUG82_15230 [Pseudomonadales bacterium]|nr:hypothetical protein [Pseudomonadales bacterium]
MSQIHPSRIPVLVGLGQSIEREKLVSIVDLTETASLAAFGDAPGLRDQIERVTTVSVIFSPSPKAPSRELVARLGLTNAECESTTAGGNTPQWAVNRAADDIAAGNLKATLIVGAESTRSMRASDPGADLFGASRGGDKNKAMESEPVVGPTMDGVLTKAEIMAGFTRPAEVYPVFESALAAKAGRNMKEQREHIGKLLAPFAKVASSNPFSWFKEAYTAEDISTPSDSNRLTAEPYTKRMNSFPNVDQGSALIVCSLEVATAAGLADQCVFPWAGATNTDVAPAARQDLGASPAVHAAAGAIFSATGLGVNDFDFIDLYSCFPSAVQVLAEAIDLSLDDSRGLTQTGGMSFFGGPGNNYTSHSIISLALLLRESGKTAYVAGNGGFLSKHSIGIYGSEPPKGGFCLADTKKEQSEINAAALTVVTEASGKATIVGGTVVYGRDGKVSAAPVVADLESGERVVASADPALLSDLAGESLVGRSITVTGSPVVYTF